MNKYAAEKISSAYYEAGIELALYNSGITKTASMGSLAKSLAKGTGVAALGAGGVVAANPGLRAEAQKGLANILTRGKTQAEAAASKAIQKLEQSAAASEQANAAALGQTSEALAKSEAALQAMSQNVDRLAIDKIVRGAYPDMLRARMGDSAALRRLQAFGDGQVGKAVQQKMQGIQGVGSTEAGLGETILNMPLSLSQAGRNLRDHDYGAMLGLL